MEEALLERMDVPVRRMARWRCCAVGREAVRDSILWEFVVSFGAVASDLRKKVCV